MGRYTGCHTYSDTVRTIQKKIWHTYRQYHRFFFCLIKVGHKIHYALIHITQKYFLCNFLKSGFRITHGSCSVSFNRAEISMSVYQCLAFFEILGHHHKSFVNGTVTMRMIFTHGIPYDTGTFSVRPIITDSQFIHIIQSSSLHRLESIPYIRQCTGNNNTHGIINIGFLHDLRIFRSDNLSVHCIPPLNIQLCILCMLINKCFPGRHFRSHQYFCHVRSHPGILDFHPL